ncbi:MAG: VTT domain-containing protein [Candidatus Gygaella obscura]|nr:VTT domain-containing protein [Candidatus Gygaella obscura]
MRKNKRLISIVVLVFLVFVILFSSIYLDIDKTKIDNFLSSYPGYLQWVLFVFLYSVVAYFIWVIKDPLKIIAAVIFGVYISSLLIWIAEIINCFLLFFTSRILIRGSFSQRFKSKWVSVLDNRIKNLSPSWIFLLRFVPLIPYRVLDTTFGFTKISFKKYLFIIIIASPVRIFWVQYIISAVGANILKNPKAIARYFNTDPLLMVLSSVYFILMLVVIFKLKRKAR